MMNEEHHHHRQYDDGNSFSSSSSSSLNSSTHNNDDEERDTEDDHAIATILAADENSVNGHHKLGRRLSHLESIPHTPRIITEIPDANDATFDHERLSDRLATYGLAELQIEGDGNCQFRALADQLLRNPDYHKYVRRKVVKQLKRFRRLYESYVPMRYKGYLKKMKKLGEWGDHVTLQAAADQGYLHRDGFRTTDEIVVGFYEKFKQKFEVKICLVTSFRDTCYIEILPNNKSPSREIWLSFWSEVHYNSLYETGEVPTRAPKKRHWLF